MDPAAGRLWIELIVPVLVLIVMASMALELNPADFRRVARLFDLSPANSFTIPFEVGLQNGALAIMIIVNLLGRPKLLVLPGSYALLALGPVGLWTAAYRLRSRD